MASYTVPTTGEYQITVFGAQGGDSLNAIGGPGAEVQGDTSLTAGTILSIGVGGQGSHGGLANGGGGGTKGLGGQGGTYANGGNGGGGSGVIGAGPNGADGYSGYGGTYAGGRGYITIDALTPSVPEPGSFALLGTGLAALGLVGWRRRRT